MEKENNQKLFTRCADEETKHTVDLFEKAIRIYLEMLRDLETNDQVCVVNILKSLLLNPKVNVANFTRSLNKEHFL